LTKLTIERLLRNTLTFHESWRIELRSLRQAQLQQIARSISTGGRSRLGCCIKFAALDSFFCKALRFFGSACAGKEMRARILDV